MAFFQWPVFAKPKYSVLCKLGPGLRWMNGVSYWAALVCMPGNKKPSLSPAGLIPGDARGLLFSASSDKAKCFRTVQSGGKKKKKIQPHWENKAHGGRRESISKSPSLAVHPQEIMTMKWASDGCDAWCSRSSKTLSKAVLLHRFHTCKPFSEIKFHQHLTFFLGLKLHSYINCKWPFWLVGVVCGFLEVE